MEEDDSVIRVLLVDDHAMFRTGLRYAIQSQPGMTVAAEAATHAEAVAAAQNAQPDIILLDLDLGDDNGFDLLPELLSASPDARVILLTGMRDPEAHRRAVRLGAMGLVLKEHAMETVLKAIEKVHDGEAWLDRAMMAAILHERARPASSQAYSVEEQKNATLTERERELIRRIGEGLKNKDIAERMRISEATVRHHLTSIFNKLNVSDRLELVIYAYQYGLAELPPKPNT
ncbi:MAG TPA: response regulator transcription factor [Roseiflexaceae bacterium]|nr:response regulator transcription factor [Roseiflexaceae bacterium]